MRFVVVGQVPVQDCEREGECVFVCVCVCVRMLIFTLVQLVLQ